MADENVAGENKAIEPAADEEVKRKRSGADSEKQAATISLTGRLAGIDFGTQRVGIAVTDIEQTIASPFEIYSRRSKKLDAQFFREFVREEQVAGFVVGLPVHMSGDESAKSVEARAFGKWLAELTDLPVVWIDERYSTAVAREMLSASTLSGKKRKAMLDKLAAQVILTTWLESRTGEVESLDG